MSQSAHCHVWSTDGRYQGTRRLTIQDRRMMTAQGWTMTGVRHPASHPGTGRRWATDLRPALPGHSDPDPSPPDDAA